MSRIDSSEMFDFLVEDHHLMNGSVEDGEWFFTEESFEDGK